MDKESKAMPTEIYNKLFKVQQEIGAISKDKKNSFYKNKYFDINKLIEHVSPILKSHNLLLLQPIRDNKVCSVIIDLDGGVVDSSLELPANLDAQKIGSAITYYRRYTLVSLLGLQAVDDDAEATRTKDSASSNKTEMFDKEIF